MKAYMVVFWGIADTRVEGPFTERETAQAHIGDDLPGSGYSHAGVFPVELTDVVEVKSNDPAEELIPASL